MVKYFSIIFSIALFSQSLQARHFEIKTSKEVLIFFDASEPEFEDRDKEDLTKSQLSEFFLHTIAPDLLIEQKIPWVSKDGKNINDIFHSLLKTFTYDSVIYYVSYPDHTFKLDDYEPLDF